MGQLLKQRHKGMLEWRDTYRESPSPRALKRLWRGLHGLSPANNKIRIGLGDQFMSTHECEAAIALYESAIEADGGSDEARLRLAKALMMARRYKAAVPVLQGVCERETSVPWARLNLAESYAALGATERSLDILDHLRIQFPELPRLYALLSRVFLKRGCYEDAVHAYEVGMSLLGLKTELRAIQCVTLAALGRADELAEIADPFRLVQEVHLDTGIASSLNRELKEQIMRSPHSVFAPCGLSTRYGHLVFLGRRDDGGAVKHLRQLICQEVERYAEHLDVLRNEPELAEATMSLSMWALVFRGRGHATEHIHPSGLISGVYYVHCPFEAKSGCQGWIEFGKPPIGLGHYENSLERSIRPKEGMMMLFPSYLYHSIAPVKAGTERISVSFDVAPIDN